MLSSKWLVHDRDITAEQAPLRMFCFPYAGGGASVYRTWGQALKGRADVYAVQLPGREERIAHPRYYSIPRLVQAILDEQSDWFDRPYVLFGHSMGAKIVFELARRMQGAGRPPLLVIVSASRSPAAPPLRQIHALPEDLFINELRSLAGTPEEILRDKGFMQLFLPLLRADFTMDETYASSAVLDIPAAIVGGTLDTEASPEDLDQWNRAFSGQFARHLIEGGHFFIRERQSDVIHAVCKELDALGIPGETGAQ